PRVCFLLAVPSELFHMRRAPCLFFNPRTVRVSHRTLTLIQAVRPPVTLRALRSVPTSRWRCFRLKRSGPTQTRALRPVRSKRGYRLATSVGGTLTGRGGDIIIIDDPIKPQDAQSEAIRKKTIQWYENTLLSRLDDKVRGAIVVVMQRLHLE